VEKRLIDDERGTVSANNPWDEDSLVPADSVITADPNHPSGFWRWLVNGEKSAETSVSMPLSGHARIQAMFRRLAMVIDSDDMDTEGTLRYAVTHAEDGDLIQVDGEARTIELTAPLEINKILIIEGNGATLTRAGSFGAANNSQFLDISDCGEVLVRRLHFKNGEATEYGGAVRNNNENLILESCIFSGNRVTGNAPWNYGGAIFSSKTLTIRGCTFYGNSAARSGGAIYFNTPGMTLTLTGNLFYGNTAGTSYPVVYNQSGSVNASHNVVDVELRSGSAQAGWTDAGTGDAYISGLLVTPLRFKPLNGNRAGDKLPESLPEGYPDTDFYGEDIISGGAAGAVQTSTPDGRFYVELSVNNSEKGIVQLNDPLDADGCAPEGSVITAIPTNPPNNEFWRWLVDGEKSTETSASITLSGHTRIQAMFRRVVAVSTFDDSGNGTLRYALENAEDGDRIQLRGPGTITLATPLPEITTSLIIEGNGTTLIRAFSSNIYLQTPLLYLSPPSDSDEVLLQKLHFKDGESVNHGGAVRHEKGNLTLESCIFSDNRTTDGWGGAVYSTDILTIRGCTFYGNIAGGDGTGGAIAFFSSKTLTLMGNLFYKNSTSGKQPVVARSPSSIVTASYNVVDKLLGTENGQAGWSGGTGDVYITGDPLDSDFAPKADSPGHEDIDIVPSGLPDFPETDFNGDTRASGTAPKIAAGAVK
jgi:hypothetical protein